MALAPGTRIGPYEIAGTIGAGGMGEVYRARDTRLAREVAIKVLPADLTDDPERRARFEREARAVSALNHPHIVTLYEVGTSDAGPYLVLEKIEGQSLRDLLNAGPLPLRRLVALAAQVADGLAKAHSTGVVHRDLKPDNVMVTTDGFAKILDFGLAKLVWPGLDAGAGDTDTTLARETASGLILGTLGYLSPEQAAGKPVDYRADQFALGALLYEMASRERPFKRGTMAESLAATLRDDPEPLRSKREDLPPPFIWIVERCLAKDPDERYASTKDLAHDLADIRDRLSDVQKARLEDERPAAPAPRRAGHWKWIAAAAGAAVLLAAGYSSARFTAGEREIPSYRALSFQRGLITGAKFSPDGRTIYYSALFGTDSPRVFVTSLDGAASQPLDLPPAHLLSVSSKGELAIVLSNQRNTFSTVGRLARVPAIGGAPRELLDDVADADWAPDGERLAVRRFDNSLEFPIGYTIARDTFTPRVAPDGGHIAWAKNAGIVIADPDGRVIAEDLMPFVFGLAWRRDGREVWFTGSESGSGYDRALYALSLDGTRRLIARAPGALTIFDVAPDGRGALVFTGAGWWTIVSERAGNAATQNLDLYGRSQVVGLSADGSRLLVNEPREVGRGLYLLATDGTPPIKLSDRFRGVGLSPDGAWALVRERESQVATGPMMLIRTSAGTPREIPMPPGLEANAGAEWSADGRRLFVKFTAPDRGDSSARVYVREDDLDWRVVTPEGVRGRFVVSADGRQVAIRDATGDLTLFPVDGGPPRPIEGRRETPVYWSRDGRWILLCDERNPDELPAPIYRWDVATGRLDLWRTFGPADLAGVITVSLPFVARDGDVLTYGVARSSNELFLLQNVR